MFFCKEEKILKGSLDSIPSHSPSVKIQIMGGKDVKANLESGFQIQFSLGFKTDISNSKKSISKQKMTIFWISFWIEVQILKGIGVKIALRVKLANLIDFS